ncbi:MAG: phosphorylase [Pseudorhodoplanes sp.]
MTTDLPALLVVTGLQREAAIAAGTGVVTICSGGRHDVLAQRLAAQRPPLGGVLSFGLAGGLSPDLKSGDVVVASHVLHGDERYGADQRWHDAILRTVDNQIRIKLGSISGSAEVVTRAADKSSLHAQTGAIAIDMESHIAAAYAARHRLPFAAIRAIGDSSSRNLPALATDALREDGSVDIVKVMRGLAANPAQMPALAMAGIDSERAFASLRRCRSLLGPLFGLGLAHV